jgi:RNA polymerase sigma-70 factor (ECF subfamily)
MSFHAIRTEIRSNGELDASLDPRASCVDHDASELNQRVTQLFEELRDSVYRYLILVVGGPAEAEEISQEAFLECFRFLQSGQTIQNIRAWIFRVAHNLAINQLKSKKYVLTMDSHFWDELCNLRCDPRPTPEQTVLHEEDFRRLHAAMGQLSPQQRQCLVLRAEGFRYKQISEIMGISDSNVAKSLHRGIKRMMREFRG